MDSSSVDFSRLLQAMRSGDREAEAELMRFIHPELRRLAAAYPQWKSKDQALQATELINELYLRLAGSTHQFENGPHFRAVAAQAVRNLLVDGARARRAGNRGEEVGKTGLDGLEAGSPAMDEKVLALEEALSRLSEWDARQARVVQLHFFGGMTEAEIGEALGMTQRSVKRDWRHARDWLYAEIGK
jgi:RNA polymerase sigma-70 factor (ECF subfamily)